MDKNSYRFLALDGALNNFGVAVGYVVNGQIQIEQIMVISPKKTSFERNKLGDARRAKVIVDQVAALENNVHIIFAELPTGSRSSAAAWSLGIALGIVVSLKKPIVFVLPHEAKSVVKARASKDEIVTWAVRQYPKLKWLRRGARLLKANEHAADAIAIAFAGARKIRGGTTAYV